MMKSYRIIANIIHHAQSQITSLMDEPLTILVQGLSGKRYYL